ncbi:hypothetical protein TNCV_113541 [Trichonephila clavipes]|nr:hypothetical protein TNCV_113541 [Trichonephila clavipes]
MLEKVIENWTSRLDYIRASRGSPMSEIIFKMRRYPMSPQTITPGEEAEWYGVTASAISPSISYSELHMVPILDELEAAFMMLHIG